MLDILLLGMLQNINLSVDDYLASLPKDRRDEITALRKFIKERLPQGIAEGVHYGMLSYYVPLDVYAEGYLDDRTKPLPFMALASQKNYISLYLMQLYSSSELQRWFEEAYEKSGKKLNMGKSCLRFKQLNDIPLNVIGDLLERLTVEEYIANYENARNSRKTD